MLEIIEIPYEDKVILSHLIQFYRYDSSEYDEHALNNHGTYLYKYLDHQWTDDYRHPYYFKIDGEFAGFALVILNVPQEFVRVSTAKETNVISDFFIMRKFRNKGYGKQAAHQIFNEFKGIWEVRQTARNIPANKFWNTVINDYTAGDYTEIILNDEKWHGPIQVFQCRESEITKEHQQMGP